MTPTRAGQALLTEGPLTSPYLSCLSRHPSIPPLSHQLQMPLPCGAPDDRRLLQGKAPPLRGPPNPQASAQQEAPSPAWMAAGHCLGPLTGPDNWPTHGGPSSQAKPRSPFPWSLAEGSVSPRGREAADQLETRQLRQLPVRVSTGRSMCVRAPVNRQGAGRGVAGPAHTGEQLPPWGWPQSTHGLPPRGPRELAEHSRGEKDRVSTEVRDGSGQAFPRVTTPRPPQGPGARQTRSWALRSARAKSWTRLRGLRPQAEEHPSTGCCQERGRR